MENLPVQNGAEDQPNSGETAENKPIQPSPDLTPKKSGKMKKILLVVTVVLGITIALYFAATQIVIPNNNPPPPIVEEPVPEENPFPEIAEDEWEDYINKQYEFSFRYPTNAKFTEQNPFSLDPSTYQVLFTRNNLEGTNEYNLVEGYLFKVVVNKSIVNTDVLKLAEEKRTLFVTTCPEAASISRVKEIEIDGFEAQTFNVTNCDGDHKETFVKRNENIFEVALTYKGDIGYKQFYKATVEQIEKSFSYTNLIAPSPLEEWVTFKGGSYTFKHPDYDETCCNIQGPPNVDDKVAAKSVVIADPATVEAGDKLFNGFAVYIVNNVSPELFNDYLNKQKAALVENYRIVVGKSPITTDKNVVIDGREGVLLEGYAWWGDMLYIPHTEGRVIVIAKTEVSPGSFDNTFGEILNTFEFAEGE